MKVKCIAKERDRNNKIVGYKLQDQQGNTVIIKPDALKSAIKTNRIEVINLTITSDNRLIDAQPVKQKEIASLSGDKKGKLLINKAKVLGYKLEKIPTACNHECTLINMGSNNHIVYIPNEVTSLNVNEIDLTFTKYIKSIHGNIKIIGGHNLKDTKVMFQGCIYDSIDLSEFDTSSVKDMQMMFIDCDAKAINMNGIDTSAVKSMKSMFMNCNVPSLNLSSFVTYNVLNMSWMFSGCDAKYINVSSFDTRNVKDMCFMFERCKAESLDLSSFNTRNVIDMYKMFDHCKAQYLNLSSFSVNSENSINNHLDKMFIGCDAKADITDCEIISEYNRSK